MNWNKAFLGSMRDLHTIHIQRFLYVKQKFAYTNIPITGHLFSAAFILSMTSTSAPSEIISK